MDRIDWSKSNSEIAAEAGASVRTVARQRKAHTGMTHAEMQARMVDDWDRSDAEIASEAKRSKAWAAKWRRALGKQPTPCAPRRAGIKWDEQPLGQVPDWRLAGQLGVHPETVRRARISRGIECTDQCKAGARSASNTALVEAHRQRVDELRRRAPARRMVLALLLALNPPVPRTPKPGPLCDRPQKRGLNKALSEHGYGYCACCARIIPSSEWMPSQVGKGHCRKCSVARTTQRRREHEPTRLATNVRRRLREVVSTGPRKRKRASTRGVDWHAIADHLGPCPGPGYTIDHIVPLRAFDLSNREQLLLACSPENHVWMRAADNFSKKDRLVTGETARGIERPRRWGPMDIAIARAAMGL